MPSLHNATTLTAYQKINDLELGSSLTITERARPSRTDLVCVILLSSGQQSSLAVLLRLRAWSSSSLQWTLLANLRNLTLTLLRGEGSPWQLVMFMENCELMWLRLLWPRAVESFWKPSLSHSPSCMLWKYSSPSVRANFRWQSVLLPLSWRPNALTGSSLFAIADISSLCSRLAKDSKLALSYRLCEGFRCRKGSSGGVRRSMAGRRLTLYRLNSMQEKTSPMSSWQRSRSSLWKRQIVFRTRCLKQPWSPLSAHSPSHAIPCTTSSTCDTTLTKLTAGPTPSTPSPE